MPPPEKPRILRNGETVDVPDGTFEHPAPGGVTLAYEVARGQIVRCVGGVKPQQPNLEEFDGAGIA